MSAGLQLIEPVVVAIVDRLAQGMEAEVEVANQDVTDGYDVEPPQLILDYVPPLSTVLQFPCLGVQHSGGTFQDDTAWSATGVWRVAVVVLVQDSDQAGLARRLRRLTRCVARVLLAQRQIVGGGVWGMTLDEVAYGPAIGEMPPDERVTTTFWSWAAVRVTCKQEEE